MTERNSLSELDEKLLEDAELEEVAGGHIVLHGKPGKAYKLYCPSCGSSHIRFSCGLHDMNGHIGEGNYEWEERRVIQQYLNGYTLKCLDCNNEFNTNAARWECLSDFDPNDYSD